MTVLKIERFPAPSTVRAARKLISEGSRAADRLAGRTVWCATALPAGRAPAAALRECLEWAEQSGVTTGAFEVAPLDPVRQVAQHLQAMLHGPRPPEGQISPDEGDVYAEAASEGDAMVGEGVCPDDVVVVHDPLTASLAQAIRERGAHVVWRIEVGTAQPGEAWSFLRRYTSAVDAYLMTWSAAGEGGVRVERIAAVMPAPDSVETRDVTPGPAAERRHDLGWSSALAAAVAADRAETVGGTRHARPGVAAR
jgi:trehalose synthase